MSVLHYAVPDFMRERDRRRHVLATASHKAFQGGLGALGGQAINVCCLMWMQTIMNNQYRRGGTFVATAERLYAEGGLRRFYQGFGPAMLLAPITRFTDVAANEFALVSLQGSTYSTPVRTAFGSMIAASARLIVLPIDAWKTTKQVVGESGLHVLMQKFKKHPLAPWYGGSGAVMATWVGHYPWFMTNNYLREHMPLFNFYLGKHLRYAVIGFCSSAVSDTCSNSLRVLKTVRQTSEEKVSYRQAVSAIIRKDGFAGLFFRGLKTRVLAKGFQGAIFTVGWQATSEYLKRQEAQQRFSSHSAINMQVCGTGSVDLALKP